MLNSSAIGALEYFAITVQRGCWRTVHAVNGLSTTTTATGAIWLSAERKWRWRCLSTVSKLQNYVTVPKDKFQNTAHFETNRLRPKHSKCALIFGEWVNEEALIRALVSCSRASSFLEARMKTSGRQLTIWTWERFLKHSANSLIQNDE